MAKKRQKGLTEKQVEDTLRAYKQCGNNATLAARKLGLSDSAVRQRLHILRSSGRLGADPTRQRVGRRKQPSGLSLDEFRSQHDPDTRMREAIRRELAKLADGQILSDREFRADLCGVASNGWKLISEEKEFLPYQFLCDGKLWWTTKRTVAQVLNTVQKARSVQ